MAKIMVMTEVAVSAGESVKMSTHALSKVRDLVMASAKPHRYIPLRGKKDELKKRIKEQILEDARHIKVPGYKQGDVECHLLF